MKYLILCLGFLFTLQSQAQFTGASLQASGLTCAMCSKAVKVALEKVPFVKEVKVDIKNQQYNLVLKENNSGDFDQLKKAVEDAGFSVASLKITGRFNHVKIEKDSHIKIGEQTFHFLNGDKETLDGEKTLTIVDKDFLTAKAFKKFSAASKMECVQTGKASTCCKQAGVHVNTLRIYHVTI